ncbi:DnaB-like helicase N-terminal domain-containing protein, partial [Pontiella sp.]
MIPGDSGGLRIPPHSDEAERGVLGSILLDPSGSLDKCLAKRLGPDSFY